MISTTTLHSHNLIMEMSNQILHCCGTGKILCITSQLRKLTGMLRKSSALAVEGDITFILNEGVQSKYQTIVVELSAKNPKFEISYLLKHLEDCYPISLCLILPYSISDTGKEALFHQVYSQGYRKHPMSLYSLCLKREENSYTLLFFEKDFSNVGLKHMQIVDLLKADDIHSIEYLIFFDYLKRHIPDHSSILLLGYHAGSLGHILRVGTFAERICELLPDPSIIEYLDSKYPTKNQRLIANQSSMKILAEDFDLLVVLANSYECWKHVLDSARKKVTLGGRLAMIIDENDLTVGTSTISLETKINTLLGPDFRIDLCWGLQSIDHESPINLELQKIPSNEFYKHKQYRKYMVLAIKIPTREEYLGIHSAGEAFAKSWVARSLVMSSQRFFDVDLLTKHAEQISHWSLPQSIERGASLCVRCYRYLEQIETDQECQTAEFGKSVDDFLSNADGTNKGALRWKISLSFAYASLLHNLGDFEMAKRYYNICISMNPLLVNPQMSTKTLLSYLNLANYAIASNQRENAKEYFQNGLRLAGAALSADFDSIIGDINHPLRFGMPEISYVAMLGARCADGLNLLYCEDISSGFAFAILQLRK